MEFKDYEKNVDKLKEMIAELEKGEMSLDENLTMYRNGMKLYRELEECLNNSKGELLSIQEGVAKPLLWETE